MSSCMRKFVLLAILLGAVEARLRGSLQVEKDFNLGESHLDTRNVMLKRIHKMQELHRNLDENENHKKKGNYAANHNGHTWAQDHPEKTAARQKQKAAEAAAANAEETVPEANDDDEADTPPPTSQPTPSPTANPTPQPTKAPTAQPTKSPTKMPTKVPTKSPIVEKVVVSEDEDYYNDDIENEAENLDAVTSAPTSANDDYYLYDDDEMKKKVKTTEAPTSSPTIKITENPSSSPTIKATEKNTEKNTASPSSSPSSSPTKLTSAPTSTITIAQTSVPSSIPSSSPTRITISPTKKTTQVPSVSPSVEDFDDDVFDQIEEKNNLFKTPEPTLSPTYNPWTSSPTRKPYYDDENTDKIYNGMGTDDLPTVEKANEQTDDVMQDIYSKLTEDEIEFLNHHEFVDEEKEAAKISALYFIITLVLMILTAHQLSENPDGVYANMCRLALTVSGLIVKIILLPFRKVFGLSHRQGYSHHLVTSDPYSANASGVELM